MQSAKGFLACLCFAFVMATTSFAQDSTSQRRNTSSRSRSDAVVSSGRVSSSTSSAGRSYSTTYTTPRISPSRGSVGRIPHDSGQSSYRSSGGSSVVPQQTYIPNYSLSWSRWYDANWFVERLIREYSFLPGYDYLWRYRQGDSLLTERSLHLALQQSAAAASGLLRLSEQLGTFVTQYEDGELSRAEFEEQVELKTKEIRKLSKKIRKDHFLDYLDQRQNDDVRRFQQVDSVSGLRTLTAELALMAQKMDQGISAFYRQDMSRVVDINHLQQPSFDALSKGIDRLAKTIEKSAERL